MITFALLTAAIPAAFLSGAAYALKHQRDLETKRRYPVKLDGKKRRTVVVRWLGEA